MKFPTWCTLPALALVLVLVAIEPSFAQSPRRVTQDAGEDIVPAWDPRGNTIAYLHSKILGGGVPRDLYQVQANGSGEGPMAIGPSSGFGLANSPSWLGNLGLLALHEQVQFHEYLLFNTSLAPFTRSNLDNNDSAFTRLLLINGGGGGGLIRFSRDATTVLWRFSTSGGGGLTTLRTADVSALSGQRADDIGNVILSQDNGADQRFLAGAALTPNGDEVILAVPSGASNTPHDLWMYSSTNAHAPIQLTFNASSGITSVHPDVSPDGTKIAFTRADATSGLGADIYIINIDGSGLTAVTNTPGFSESNPSFSPDGNSVAYSGVHLVGQELAFPPLKPGEVRNQNIYVQELSPSTTVVTPQTQLILPPEVIVQDRSVTLLLQLFKKAQLKAKRTARELAAKTKPKTKISFRYEASVSRSEQGTQAEIARKTSKRNQVTLSNLNPGAYSAKYRVQILSKKPGKPARVKATTNFSPSAEFAIE